MKKIFYTSVAALMFVVAFSLQSQNNEIVINDAFADGTCCKEDGGSCKLNGKTYPNRTYKKEGSCGGSISIQAIQ